MFNLENINYFINNYKALNIFFLNIFVYIVLFFTVIAIILFFNTNNLKTINNWKFLNSYSFLANFLILVFLSFAGIPPLLGFLSKFCGFIFLLIQNHFFLFFYFATLNFFMIYFYIQNIRFLVSSNNNTSNLFFTTINTQNNFYLLSFCVLYILNLGSIFILDDLLIFTSFISSFLIR